MVQRVQLLSRTGFSLPLVTDVDHLPQRVQLLSRTGVSSPLVVFVGLTSEPRTSAGPVVVTHRRNLLPRQCFAPFAGHQLLSRTALPPFTSAVQRTSAVTSCCPAPPDLLSSSRFANSSDTHQLLSCTVDTSSHRSHRNARNPRPQVELNGPDHSSRSRPVVVAHRRHLLARAAPTGGFAELAGHRSWLSHVSGFSGRRPRIPRYAKESRRATTTLSGHLPSARAGRWAVRAKFPGQVP